MREPTDLERQQYARLRELLDVSHQRYLEAGGDPDKTHSGLPGHDYLSDAERVEMVTLMRQLAGIRILGEQAHYQGRSWQIQSPSEIQPS
ncbi:MAG: hypothetical protein LH702_31180 [Phormidesmis sp. CAN_BIN44]|nr:hypothetical protein [Phormidesmis sp. CAN_BIN44]